MSIEREVDKDLPVLFLDLVRIKTLEDVFRNIGGAGGSTNMKYTRCLTVSPFPVRFMLHDPTELILRPVQ
jgi:hypothetical protein